MEHLLPPLGPVDCVKRVYEAGSELVAVRAPFRQLSRLDSEKLPDGLNLPAIGCFPGSQAISAKSAFAFS